MKKVKKLINRIALKTLDGAHSFVNFCLVLIVAFLSSKNVKLEIEFLIKENSIKIREHPVLEKILNMAPSKPKILKYICNTSFRAMKVCVTPSVSSEYSIYKYVYFSDSVLVKEFFFSTTPIEQLPRLNILMDSRVQASKNFCECFSGIINGKEVEGSSEKAEGDFVFFATPNIYPEFNKVKKRRLNWIYGDKAYFGRDRFYRMTLNNKQLANLRNGDVRRFEELGLKLQNTQKNGSHILICPQSDTFFRLNNMDPKRWLDQTIEEIRRCSDRPIRVRHKAKFNSEAQFQNDLFDVHCVVVMSSVAGVQAVLNGIPCIATDPTCVSALIGETDFQNIETLKLPDNRLEVCANLANNQWTLEEIRSGKAMAMLFENQRL